MSDHEMSIVDMISALLGPGQRSSLDGLTDSFAMMSWAEEEIEAARAKYGETDLGPLHRSFGVLALPPEYGFQFESIYRAHCRELLARVHDHKDLVPATDAEVIIALKQTSMIAPLKSEAVTLYFRLMARTLPDMWAKSNPDMIRDQKTLNPAGALDSLEAYEAVHGAAADEIDSYARTHVQPIDRSGYDPHTAPADPVEPERQPDE